MITFSHPTKKNTHLKYTDSLSKVRAGGHTYIPFNRQTTSYVKAIPYDIGFGLEALTIQS